MPHQRLVSLVVIVLTLFIITPRIVHADDNTPPDAPYQETYEEPTSESTEPTEPAPEEPAPTLPPAHNSPMTPADPTRDPDVPAATTTSDNTETNGPTAPSTTVQKRRTPPVAITAALTPRAIQTLHIWNNPKTSSLENASLVASSAVSSRPATDMARNGFMGISIGLILAGIGSVIAIFRKRHI